MIEPAQWHTAVDQLIGYGRRLNTEGLAVGPAGNISVRLGDRILITPSQVPYDQITPESMCVLDLDGSHVAGTGKPSAETPMHVRIYQQSEARSIVHTHSPMAVAVSTTIAELPAVHYAILRLGGSTVRVAPYARFGSDELAQAALTAMEGRNSTLLQNHGTISYADDLDTAFERAQLLEWLCSVYINARLIGSPRILNSDELQAVSVEARKRRYGAEAVEAAQD